MKFALMGLKMARRSFTRSVLAVLSIAFATVTLIAAGHLAMGHPGEAASTARAFIGGDVLVFPQAMAVEDAALHPEPSWRLSWGDPDGQHLLSELLPSAFHRGVMVDEAACVKDLEGMIPEIKQVDGVTGVYPVYSMPALIKLGDELTLGSLRARDPERDQKLGLDEYLTEGKYLSAPGQAVVENWVPETEIEGRREFGYDRFDGQRIFLSGAQPVVSSPQPAGQIRVSVPSHRAGVWDYTDPEEFFYEVVGSLQLPTRKHYWSRQRLTMTGLTHQYREDRDYPSRFIRETRYWTTPQVQLGWEDFFSAAEAAGWEPEPSALAVSVESPALTGRQVEDIRRLVAGGTVVSVADWFENHQMSPEPMLAIPPGDILQVRSEGEDFPTPSFAPPQVVVSMITWSAYIMGAMLYAGTVYIVLMRRRQQLALMKVLGATNGQVLCSVLTEMVTLGAVGSLIGLGVMSPPVLWQLGTAAGTAGDFLRTVAGMGGQVLLVAVAVCVIFGGVPAYLLVSRAAEESLAGGGD